MGRVGVRDMARLRVRVRVRVRVVRLEDGVSGGFAAIAAED